MDLPSIQVNLYDATSLETALQDFSAHLRELYRGDSLEGKVAAFVSPQNTQFGYTDVLNPQQCKALFQVRLNLESRAQIPPGPLSEDDVAELQQPQNYPAFSHLVAFQYALQQPRLLPVIVSLCEELVQYSLRQNSSDALYLSGRFVFGLYLLVMLAEQHPEYAYLVGDYFPQDGDYYDIKNHFADAVSYLFNIDGYSAQVLNVIASCRCASLHGAMYDNHLFSKEDRKRLTPDLLSCFLADQSLYQVYKRAMIEAFRRSPRLLDDEIDLFDYLESCLLELANAYEEEEDFSHPNINEDDANEELDELMFHGRTFGEERQLLTEAVQQVLDATPLKQLWYYEGPVFDDTTTMGDIKTDPFYQPYDKENEYQTNKDFWLQCFSQGEQILAYIEHNQHPELLAQLQPTDLRQLALQHKHFIYRRFENDTSVHTTPVLRLRDVMFRFLRHYRDPQQFDPAADDAAAQAEKCLRTLDVLARLTGTRELNRHDLAIICKDFKLCDSATARQRFNLLPLASEAIQKRLYSHLNAPLADHLGLSALEEAHYYYQRLEPAAFTATLDNLLAQAVNDTPADILAAQPILQNSDHARGTQLLGLAYILYREQGSAAGDALQPIWDFYQHHLFKRCYFELQTFNAFDQDNQHQAEQRIAAIADYVEGGDTKISEQQALDYARELMIANAELDDELEASAFFTSDAIGLLLASVVYAAPVAEPGLQQKLLRLYRLFLQTLPYRTLLSSFIEFSDGGQLCGDATADELNAFSAHLNGLGIDPQYEVLARILVIHQANYFDDNVGKFSDRFGLKTLYSKIVTAFRNSQHNPSIVAAVELLNNQDRMKLFNSI